MKNTYVLIGINIKLSYANNFSVHLKSIISQSLYKSTIKKSSSPNYKFEMIVLDPIFTPKWGPNVKSWTLYTGVLDLLILVLML